MSVFPEIGQLTVGYFAQPLTRLRRGPGLRDAAGRYSPGTVTATQMVGAVSVPRPDTLKELPEGRRQEGAIRINSLVDMQTAEEPDVHDSDWVLYDGRYYDVVLVKHVLAGGFYVSTCTKLDHEKSAATCYFGVGAAGLDAAGIAALSPLLLSTLNAHVDVTAGAGQAVYWASPASFGTPSFEGLSGTDRTVTIGGVVYNVRESALNPGHNPFVVLA